MARIFKRIWKSAGPLGRKVKHVAYGYTLYRADGQRERKVKSGWLTEQDALAALNARFLEIEAGQLARPTERTFAALVEEYLAYKRDHGKRSLKDDDRILKRTLLPALGAAIGVKTLTGPVIAQYERRRAGR
jgi:hypothetical protein